MNIYKGLNNRTNGKQVGKESKFIVAVTGNNTRYTQDPRHLRSQGNKYFKKTIPFNPKTQGNRNTNSTRKPLHFIGIYRNTYLTRATRINLGLNTI